MNLLFLNQPELEALHDYPLLIEALEQALRQAKIQYPLRQHHTYQDSNTLLVMPSWQDDRDIGPVGEVRESLDNLFVLGFCRR